MHSSFEMTWKLSSDELTFSTASDIIADPVTFKRDQLVLCVPEKERS